MKYEFISTYQVLLKLQEKCTSRLLNAVFDENRVITTEYSLYWDATPYIINDTKVSRLNKIQVITLFLTLGGIVNFDGHQYSPASWDSLWENLSSHKYISQEDLAILKSNWGFAEKIDIL